MLPKWGKQRGVTTIYSSAATPGKARGQRGDAPARSVPDGGVSTPNGVHRWRYRDGKKREEQYTYMPRHPARFPPVRREKSIPILLRSILFGQVGGGRPRSMACTTGAQNLAKVDSATSTARATTRCRPPCASQNKTAKHRHCGGRVAGPREEAGKWGIARATRSSKCAGVIRTSRKKALCSTLFLKKRPTRSLAWGAHLLL